MSDNEQSDPSAQTESMREQADRCRRLSRSVYDRATAELLDQMAQKFERGVAANED